MAAQPLRAGLPQRNMARRCGRPATGPKQSGNAGQSDDDKPAAPQYRDSHATKDLTAWFGEAAAPLLSGEVRKRAGYSVTKGVDGESRLTGARIGNVRALVV